MQSRAERAQGYRKEAEKFANLARFSQPHIASVHRTLAERYAWMAKNLEQRESLASTMVSFIGTHG
jgi:hypothetical protein